MTLLRVLPPLLLVACTADPTGTGPDGAGPDGGPSPTDSAGSPDPTGPTPLEVALALNELVPSNASGLQDDGGAYPDWIELHNGGDEPVDLEGYALSETDGWKDQWVFPPGVTIAAGGFLVVFADGDTGEGPLHTSFKLSSAGETLNLYGPEAAGSPWLDTADFPALAPDVAWARATDGDGAWASDPTPTPGERNE